MAEAEVSGARRLFFALWPPTALADEVVPRAARCALGGRLVPRERLHLTLFFVGACSHARQAELIRRAELLSLACARFSLVIDCLGGFADSGSAWFGISRPPGTLVELAADLADAAPASVGAPHAFVPHITVARKTRPPVEQRLFPPLIWHVDRFFLAESGDAGQPGAYRLLQSWPLG